MIRNESFYKQIAELHIEGITSGFLSSLGIDFLCLLYEAIDKSDEAVIITREEGGRVVGFVSGARSLKPIYKEMIRHLPRLIYALAPAMLRPRKVKRILEVVFQTTQGTVATSNQYFDVFSEFELLSISVSPSVRRKGVASDLYQELVNYALKMDLRAFKIIVGNELLGAHRFYAKMGAIPSHLVSVHGVNDSTLYVQQCTDPIKNLC